MKRYPAYKYSGSAALGNIPEGWCAAPLKRNCSFFTGWTPPTGNADDYVGQNLWVNISDLKQKYITDTAKRLSDDAISRYNMYEAVTGSLLFSFKLSVGQVSIAATSMYTNEAIAIFPPQEGVNLKYAYYAFPNMIAQNASENIYGAKILNQELIRSAIILTPPPEEQVAIATFLDRETAKIDALVNEQQRLIELLKEKRQAVIAHAVTKGLDPNVKMKPSGVEWLGDVPEHWEVKPIKSIASLFGRIGFRGYTTDDIVDEGEGAISLSPRNMIESRINLESCTYISFDKYNESPEIMVSNNDIIMVKTGSTYGKVSIVDNDALPETTINPQLIIFKNLRLNPYFLLFFLESKNVQDKIKLSNTGSTIPTVTQEMLSNLRIAVPPYEEAMSTVNEVKNKIEKYSCLLQETRRVIALLQERRSALISEAVTGKIDVRSLVSDQQVAAE